MCHLIFYFLDEEKIWPYDAKSDHAKTAVFLCVHVFNCTTNHSGLNEGAIVHCGKPQLDATHCCNSHCLFCVCKPLCMVSMTSCICSKLSCISWYSCSWSVPDMTFGQGRVTKEQGQPSLLWVSIPWSQLETKLDAADGLATKLWPESTSV